MKKSILKKLVLTSCFLAILFTSCEKEPLEEENANYISNIKKTKVNFADFKENKKAFDVLNLTDTKPNIKNLNVQNATSYNFDIDFNDGTHLSYHNLESYTFPINRAINNNLLENIVISEHNDGKYYAKLLKYNLTSQEKIDLASDELKSIQNPIITEVLGEYSFGNQIQSNCGFETHTIITPCANGHTSVSQCQLTGAAAPRIRTVTVAIDCTGGEGGGGGGVYNTPNFPNETTPIEYYENGISEPVLSTADAQLFSLFLNDLRAVDLAGYNYLIANPEIKNQIFGYLTTNTFTFESKIYSNFAINKIKTGAKVDFQKKVISDPSFVGTKSECVHKKLMLDQTNFYSQMLLKFNSTTKSNLTFKIGNNQNGEWGITRGTPNSINNYEITVNNNVENGSNLMRIVVLSHELIHAYMLNALEDTGVITFNVNGQPLLSTGTLNCTPGTNYNNVNLNSLPTDERFVALLCAMEQNGVLTVNNEQWTHQLFNSATFNITTYRQNIENMIFNTHDWDNETSTFKNQAINTWGTNWRRDLSTAVSWIGLEKIAEYGIYKAQFDLLPFKQAYILDLKNNIAIAKNTCQ